MSRVVVAAHALTRRFGNEQALTGVDLELRVGEVVALVGLNGAGKSTLMRLLLGMLLPDTGTVAVLGRPVGEADAAVWSHVGHLIETPPRYGELTVLESVYSAARLQGLDRGRAHRQAAATIERLELSHWQRRPTRTLSLGNRQRLGIAMALVHDPSVLVLDEPSNALDPLGVVRVRELLQSMASERGAAVLVSSHHLDEVARMADRIVVLHRGRLLGELDPVGQDIEHEFFERVLQADRELAVAR
jgi:ABC-2 type transport system ATP-binding protein